MQLRRVLLLFALVLGLSAVVASIVPAPETRDEAPSKAPSTAPTASPRPSAEGERVVRFGVPRRKPLRVPTRRVPVGAAISLRVAVHTPGDVAVGTLGVRQTADPLTPATFDLLADVAGRHAVEFQPPGGSSWLVGRLVFTRRQRGR